MGLRWLRLHRCGLIIFSLFPPKIKRARQNNIVWFIRIICTFYVNLWRFIFRMMQCFFTKKKHFSCLMEISKFKTEIKAELKIKFYMIQVFLTRKRMYFILLKIMKFTIFLIGFIFYFFFKIVLLPPRGQN